MSIYTTEVRWICESEAETWQYEYNSIDAILNVAAPKIFNFSFPIFDENYRLTLEKKILRHYYTREISEETVALWKLRLEDRLNLIMPYYNKLYETTVLDFNPLYDVDVTTTGNRAGQSEENGTQTGSDKRIQADMRNKDDTYGEVENENYNKSRGVESAEERAETNRNINNGIAVSSETNSTESENESDNTHWKLYSDTPQGGIEGIIGNGDQDPTINNNYYLTNATKETDDTSGSSSSDSQSERNESTNVIENSEYSGNKTANIDESENLNRRRDKNNTLSSFSSGNTNESGSFDKSNTRDVNNTEQYIERIFGKRGSLTYSKMIEEFRDIIINIDALIIGELSDLFFGLWA